MNERDRHVYDCVGMNERDRHVYDYSKQDHEEHD